jgi:hypothetical protein
VTTARWFAVGLVVGLLALALLLAWQPPGAGYGPL